jgi:M3 family oligoendopeptidase
MSNLKFDEIPYKRPNLKSVSRRFEAQIAALEAAPSAQEQFRALRRINVLKEDFSAMFNLCYIRHTGNTNDPFYEKENDYFDKNIPQLEALNNRFVRALLGSPFRPALEKKYGKQFFTLSELNLKTFHPSIIEDLTQENLLSSEYTKVKAKAKIDFEGQTYNLSGLQPLEESDDRNTRRAATAAKWAFFDGCRQETERIFDDLVRLRHGMAVKMGYKNFVELGYARMRRSDYTPEMVAIFRKQVRDHVVPLATELYRRQAKRLGLKKLKHYDEAYKFASGNPKPIGSPEEIVQNAARMYKALSPDTDVFFQRMQDANLMDLVNREGKATGGYCTYLSKFEMPYIYSNFNGTSGDIDVLTHEAGHAFQVWSSRKWPFEEYHWPTSDAAEIHSMSMEFLTWPWMHLFFGDQTDKYHYLHLSGGMHFLPYGVAVDEFQHIVYENPDMTPAERNAAWRDLEKIYLPHRDYDGIDYLEEGCYWQRQNHIFNSPFYYIDYTLAQICAYQFWARDRKNHDKAWADYLRLCKAGGSRSFVDLVRLARLKSPFEEGSLKKVVGEVRKYLRGVDDSAF